MGGLRTGARLTGAESYMFHLDVRKSGARLCKLATASEKKVLHTMRLPLRNNCLQIRLFDFVATNPGHVPGMGTGGACSQIGEHTVSSAPVLFLHVTKSA